MNGEYKEGDLILINEPAAKRKGLYRISGRNMNGFALEGLLLDPDSVALLALSSYDLDSMRRSYYGRAWKLSVERMD